MGLAHTLGKFYYHVTKIVDHICLNSPSSGEPFLIDFYGVVDRYVPDEYDIIARFNILKDKIPLFIRDGRGTKGVIQSIGPGFGALVVLFRIIHFG